MNHDQISFIETSFWVTVDNCVLGRGNISACDCMEKKLELVENKASGTITSVLCMTRCGDVTFFLTQQVM